MLRAKLQPRGCALLMGLLLGLTPASLFAIVLHVAPDGNDAWSGSLAEPKVAMALS
jgi:hypothetical protein